MTLRSKIATLCAVVMVCGAYTVRADTIIPVDPSEVIEGEDKVDTSSTFKPKVTALHNLNAKLSKNIDVYFIPKLSDLDNLKNIVSDCADYSGARKRFAVVYDGYFDNHDGEVYEYKNTQSARELSILGTDFLLHNEYIQIKSPDDIVYQANKVDVNQGVPLGTAIMDIYKAVGKDIINNTIVFKEDKTLSVETSPVQEQISLTLDSEDAIDVTDGAAWVFSTRTNPDTYWKLAVQNGIVSDADMSGSGRSKSSIITLAQFCDYAHRIMYVTGEPVMTTAEKNILLQVYGSVIPYKSCTDDEVKAIETLIAKGIISPDEDAEYLNFGSEIDFGYMLTLLMRIADVNSRATYKDVQITMDVNLMNNDYYNAKLTTEVSPIKSLEVARGSARVTSYYDYAIDKNELMKAVDEVYPDLDSALKDGYLAGHLVFKSFDGKYYPLSTQVGAYKKTVFTEDSTNYDVEIDGPLMLFCISDGVKGNSLRLRLVSFDVEALMNNGKYEIHVMSDDGKVSDTCFLVEPGGGSYASSGVKTLSRDDSLITNEPLELSNESVVNELIKLYYTDPVKAQELYKKSLDDNWTDDEKAAAYEAAYSGIHLASDATYTYYLRLNNPQDTNSIVVTDKKGNEDTLANIMSRNNNPGMVGSVDDLVFKKITDTLYQVDNCPAGNAVSERIKGVNSSSYTTAFCKRDEELVVSATWLKNSGFINKMPYEVSDGVICVSNDYMNIYLDNKNKHVVVGACVYSCDELESKEQIWFKTTEGEYFLNYRAALGWTGDFMVFKNDGGTISVSVSANAFNASDVSNKFTENTIEITQYSTPATGVFAGYKELNVKVLGNGDKNSIPMTAMYPFANYLVYVDDGIWEDSEEYHDWLFVFKPANIKYNGKKLDYDDTADRQYLLNNLAGFTNLDKSIKVWAYPLYKNGGKGMPKEMTWSDKYGYIYTPASIKTNLDDVYESYFNMSMKDKNPEYALPFVKLDSGKFLCFNYNIITCENGSNGNTETLEYGAVPYTFLSSASNIDRLSDEDKQKIKQTIISPTYDGKYTAQDTGYEIKNSVVFPAVTSPALSILNLAKYKAPNIFSNLNNGSELYMGTMPCKLTRSDKGVYELRCGTTILSNDASDEDFMVMRDTGRDTSQVGKWYSCSAYGEYEMVNESTSEETEEKKEGPKDGLLDINIDNVDWGKYKLSTLLNNFDGGITILTILVLNIIPRIAMFLFLILIMLSVIQNVKIWRLFCVKIFDPYKFLTLGRQDVETFNGRRMFFTSIIAMGVFGLFMDGIIIQLYAWLVRLVVILIGG